MQFLLAIIPMIQQLASRWNPVWEPLVEKNLELERMRELMAQSVSASTLGLCHAECYRFLLQCYRQLPSTFCQFALLFDLLVLRSGC